LDASPRLLVRRARDGRNSDVGLPHRKKQTPRIFSKNDYSPPVNKREGREMNLSPPTTVVFIVSLILAALAVIGKFAPIPFITDHGFWVAIVAYVVLAVGNLFRGV
jgi:hypothetical protein